MAYQRCQSDKYSDQTQTHQQLRSKFPSLSSHSSLPAIPSIAMQFSDYYQNHSLITTLKGHTSSISSSLWPETSLYTGSSDREIRLWRLSDSDHQDQTDNFVAAGKGAVKSLVVSEDNKLFSAHQDHKIRVWKISTDLDRQKYTRLATLPTLGDRTSKLLLTKNQVQIRRHKKCSWVHHVDTVSALALSLEESLMYSVSWDRTLKIWRLTDFKCLESVFNAHDDAINAVALASDGYVYTGSADKKIKVWKRNPEGKTHYLVASLEKHNSAVNALALNNNGSVLFSGASDRSILVWEKNNDENGEYMDVVDALKGHRKPVLCLAMASDFLCSGSADKTIRIWTNGDRRYTCLTVLEGHTAPVKCLAAAAVSDGDQGDDESSVLVYSGGLDCDIKVWKISLPLHHYP